MDPDDIGYDTADFHGSARSTGLVLVDVATVGGAMVGLLIGIRLATAGYPAFPSLIGGVIVLPVVVRIVALGVLSLARRLGL